MVRTLREMLLNPRKRRLLVRGALQRAAGNDGDDDLYLLPNGKRSKLELWRPPPGAATVHEDDSSDDDDIDEDDELQPLQPWILVEKAPPAAARVATATSTQSAKKPPPAAAAASLNPQKGDEANADTADDEFVSPEYCQGINTYGEPCGRVPTPGQLYCYKHNPNKKKPPPRSAGEPVYTRCFAIAKRGGRCSKMPKEGKFCLYHCQEGSRLYGVIDNDEDEEAHDGNVTRTVRDVGRARADESLRGTCRALCKDGYRCARRATLHSPYCNYHIEYRIGDYESGEEEEKVEDDRKSWEPQHTFSSGAEQCVAINMRNHRCSKPAFGQSVYCSYHIKPEKRTRTIFDLEGSGQGAGAAKHESEDAIVYSETPPVDPSSFGISDEHCRAISVASGKRCQKRVYDGGEFCNYHSQSRQATIDDYKDGGIQCIGMHDRNRRRCVRVAEAGSRFCSEHRQYNKQANMDEREPKQRRVSHAKASSNDDYDDDGAASYLESEEDDEYEEVIRMSKKGDRPRDYMYRGEPGTVPCHALTFRMRVCTHQAVKGSKFCNRHIAMPPKFTRDSGLATTEGLGGGMLRFFRDDEPGNAQCDAYSNHGKICPYVADDDSVHCYLHKGSNKTRCKLYYDEPGCRPCEAYGDDKGTPCPYQADDGSVHCHAHKGSGNNMKRAPSEVASKPSFDAESDEASFTDRPRTKNGFDKHFKGRDGEVQCVAPTRRGKQCGLCAVGGTNYCYRHEELKYLPGNQIELSREESDGKEGKAETGNTAEGNSNDSSLDTDDDVSSTERPFSYREFLKMWRECEEFCGEEIHEIEDSQRVRGANHRMSPEDTDGQAKAQYGRLLPPAMKTLTNDILNISKDDVFLDIGHGIGNACIQASLTVGCEARGIEVVYGRNSVAEVFCDQMLSRAKKQTGRMPVGEVKLKHGRLEDPAHREFLTKGVTRAYVNNFNGVFAERSVKSNQNYFLDDYIAGLFALMAPGSIMVTLHPLSMGPTRNEANQTRVKVGLQTSEYAGFYDLDKILLGRACDTVKWNQHSGNQKNIYVYRYERLEQPSEEAVFLCGNPTCKVAKDETPIPAATTNEEGRTVMNHCSCKVSTKNLRRQRRKLYADTI